MELPPATCPNGHRLGPGRVLVGWQACDCGGHRTWACRECDGVVYGPEVGAACSVLNGPADPRNL
jgi:hypothetical protein